MATEGRRTVLFEDHPAIYVSVRARVTGHFRRRLLLWRETGWKPTDGSRPSVRAVSIWSSPVSAKSDYGRTGTGARSSP